MSECFEARLVPNARHVCKVVQHIAPVIVANAFYRADGLRVAKLLV
jgi:hypothetical protein